jgi:CheY-like chemotaxis protein
LKILSGLRPVEESDDTMPNPNPSALTILLIDDCAEERAAWKRHLESLSSHYHCAEADSGRIGIDYCQSLKPDCVVLEIDLKDMSGFEVLQEVVPDYTKPTTAFVILTRLNFPPGHYAAKIMGAQESLQKKSATPLQLQEAIRNAITQVAAES